VTAPENQFGEFLERKRESLRVPDWAWFTGGELSISPSCYMDLAGTGSAYGAQVTGRNGIVYLFQRGEEGYALSIARMIERGEIRYPAPGTSSGYYDPDTHAPPNDEREKMLVEEAP